LHRMPHPPATLARQLPARAACHQSRSFQRPKPTDCSVSSRLPVPPMANFRLAPDVILRLPGSLHFRLAPVAPRSGLTYLLPPACAQHSIFARTGSPVLDLHPKPISNSPASTPPAHAVCASLRHRLCLAPPACADYPNHLLSWRPSPELQLIHASFGLRRRLPLFSIRQDQSPPAEPEHSPRLTPYSEPRSLRRLAFGSPETYLPYLPRPFRPSACAVNRIFRLSRAAQPPVCTGCPLPVQTFV